MKLFVAKLHQQQPQQILLIIFSSSLSRKERRKNKNVINNYCIHYLIGNLISLALMPIFYNTYLVEDELK